MKAVVLYGPGDVRLGELPKPSVSAGEVCIKVAYCGICGSDFHKAAGKEYIHPVDYPLALGHEISGVITEVGEGVSAFQVGDRVTVDPNWSCGKCYYCKNGQTSFCENGRGVVKGMAEYVVSPEENVPEIMDLCTQSDAKITRAFGCTFYLVTSRSKVDYIAFINGVV